MEADLKWYEVYWKYDDGYNDTECDEVEATDSDMAEEIIQRKYGNSKYDFDDVIIIRSEPI